MAYKALCQGDPCHNNGKYYFCDIKGKMICCGTQATSWWWVEYD